MRRATKRGPNVPTVASKYTMLFVNGIGYRGTTIASRQEVVRSNPLGPPKSGTLNSNQRRAGYQRWEGRVWLSFLSPSLTLPISLQTVPAVEPHRTFGPCHHAGAERVLPHHPGELIRSLHDGRWTEPTWHEGGPVCHERRFVSTGMALGPSHHNTVRTSYGKLRPPARSAGPAEDA